MPRKASALADSTTKVRSHRSALWPDPRLFEPSAPDLTTVGVREGRRRRRPHAAPLEQGSGRSVDLRMDVWALLWIAILPGAGFLAGALAAELIDPPPWLLGALLHAAAGVAMAVVVLELGPRSFGEMPTISALIAFAAGAALSVLTRAAAEPLRRRWGSAAGQGAVGVYIAAGADLLSDGLMTGAGASVAQEVGLLLALSQLAGNAPSGFAAAANLRDRCGPRPLRLGLAFGLTLLPLFAALAGWAVLRGAGDIVRGLALAGVAGLLLTATIEDLVPEADRPRARRWLSSGAFATGFVGLAALGAVLSG